MRTTLVGEHGTDCPFCDVAALRSAARFMENELCVYTSSSPRHEATLPGSGIIVPRAHRASPFDLTADEWLATAQLLSEVKREVDAAFHPDGYNLGWNVGTAAGQEVEHAHLHVIPRHADEPYAGRGIRWWLKQPENRRPPPSA